MTSWWLQRPGLLDEELAALERRGVQFRVDEAAKAAGVLRVDFELTVDGDTIALFAVYPDLYPFFRPEVYAPALQLPRHQNPAAGNLCLLGRGTENWSVDETLADLVSEQLPLLIRAARRQPGAPLEVPEVDQGEPITDYVGTQVDSVVLWDSLPTPAAEQGQLLLKIEADGDLTVDPSHPNVDAPILRGVLAEVRDNSGAPLVTASADLVAAIDRSIDVRGRWVRLASFPQPPRGPHDLNAFVGELTRLHPQLADVRAAPMVQRHRLDIVGLVFPEEVARDTWADSWLFLVRAYRGRSQEGRLYLARGQRAGSEDMASRIPELADLRAQKVALVGVGGIGSTVALELARAQIGELRIVDHDIVDAATSVRWPFGLQAAGRPKVAVLREWLALNYPYTKIQTWPWRVGSVRLDAEGPTEQLVLDQLLDGVDLLVDASAEYGLHYLLATEARARHIPFLEVATRNGAWGGHVARIRGSACWLCYQVLVEALRNSDPPIAPAADPAPLHQPVGCADPTFTGSGFDVAEFGIIAARTAVATLLGGTGQYPDVPWDLAIINLRTPSGVPHWQTFQIQVASDCPARHDLAA